MDPDLKAERPMPGPGYEYARDAILTPIFTWRPETVADRLRVAIPKSRKVLGTLWTLGGCAWEIVFQDSVAWKLAKGKREEAVDLISEPLRFAINHRDYPDWLRKYRPIRSSPMSKFARYEPGAPRGVYKSVLSAVGTNFGSKEAKGGTNDFLIDEAVEIEGLRSAVEAAAPGARRIVMIATPPEPHAKGKRIDPDSVAFFREWVEGRVSLKPALVYPSHARRESPDEFVDDAELVGAM
jgi:hypothetical protein